jgi:hypothetical protein
LTSLNDLGDHHITVEANGSVVKFFVDGIYGGSAPFPYTNGISFGLGSYVDTGNNLGSVVEGYFANPTVSGPAPVSPVGAKLAIAMQANGQLLISWTGSGTLQSASSLSGGWAAVTPAPTGTSYTVSPAANKMLFFRLLQ